MKNKKGITYFYNGTPMADVKKEDIHGIDALTRISSVLSGVLVFALPNNDFTLFIDLGNNRFYTENTPVDIENLLTSLKMIKSDISYFDAA